MILYQSVPLYCIVDERHYQWPGRTSLKTVLEQGDFGCGALKNYEAEVVVLDGNVYTIGGDGKVFKPSIDEKCAVTLITQFKPKYSFDVKEETPFEDLINLMKEEISHPSNPYAVKCTGLFKEIKGRSVYPHTNDMPYNGDLLPLYDYFDCEGTVLGYIFPRRLDVVCGGDGGYHFHFIDKTKTFGCHVFQAVPLEIKVEIMPINKLVLNFDSESQAAV